MSKDTESFSRHLEEIRENLQKCKIEREKRYFEFAKRVERLKARHDKLTSDRLRRLSFEGINIDINSIRCSQKGDNMFKRSKTSVDFLTPTLQKEYLEPILTHLEGFKQHAIGHKISDDVENATDEHSEICEKEQQLCQKLHLEMAFDSRNANNISLKKNVTPRLKRRHELNGTQIRSSVTLKPTMQCTAKNKNKFQSAFAKVLRVQKFTSQRRHTLLSMAPIDIGTKSQLSASIVCDNSTLQTQKQNNVTLNNLNLTGQKTGNVKPK